MPRISKAEARDLSWRRGDLWYKLKPAQRRINDAFHASTARLFYGDCSRGIGKSYWAAVKCIEVALNCPHMFPRIFYAAATKTELKRFAIPAIDMMLSDCPDDLRPTFVKSELKYVFPHNGAEIHLIGLDKDPDGGRGNYCDLYIFEEAGFIDRLDYLYSSVVFPMAVRRQGSRIVMISTRPETPAHPLITEFLPKAMAENSYIMLTIDDNTMMTPAEKAEAQANSLNETTWLREYHCQSVTESSLHLCPEWRPEHEQKVARPSYFKQLHRYVAMDLGTKIDLTAILYGYYDRLTSTLHVEAEDEINGPEMTTPGVKHLVLTQERKLWESEPPYRRIADNDNPLLLQDLGALHGLNFAPTGKDELKAMVDQIRVMVKEGRLKVDPECKKTIGCLRYGLWDKHRKKFNRHPVYGHFDHFAALVYLVRNIDLHGGDPIALPGEKKKPSEATAIQKALFAASGLANDE